MRERHRPLGHLARSVEELLRAGAETLAAVRERNEQRGDPAPLEAALERMAERAARWLSGTDNGTVQALRGALQREVNRWDLRASDDPAALRVRVSSERPAGPRAPVLVVRPKNG